MTPTPEEALAARETLAPTQAGSDAAARRFRIQMAWVLGLGMVLLGLLVIASLVLFTQNRSYSRWVDHTYQAEAKANAVSSVIERLETARRGYLLSPQDNYWQTYITSKRMAGDEIADLRRFTSDNPVQQANTADLQSLLDEKLGQLTRTIDVAHGGDLPAARATFLREQDQKVTERLRVRLTAIVAEEQRLLKLRGGRENGNAVRLLLVNISAALLLAVLAGGSVVLLRRYSADLRVSEIALRQVNEGLEAAVKARTTELTRANEEIQRFAYIVSHDLRSPLVNVMGFTAELETAIKPLTALIEAADAKDPELVSKDARAAVTLDLPESVGFIRTSTQKMDRLINAILRLSREGRRNLTPELLDMDGLVGSVIDNLRMIADSRGAEVVAESPLPVIESDRVAVEQVLANLVENAIKYAKPGRPGRVVVRGRPVGDRVIFEVEDNGRGIAATDHERVFDLFRRAGAQDQPGEGIGLAHVRALVYRLGGLIDCKSEVDRGSTFRVYLPRRAPRETTKAA